MKPNPILEEVWRIKDQLAAEADYDIDQFVAQLRAWSAAHPVTGPVVRNAEELRRLVSGKGGQGYCSIPAEPARVRETPPKQKKP